MPDAPEVPHGAVYARSRVHWPYLIVRKRIGCRCLSVRDNPAQRGGTPRELLMHMAAGQRRPARAEYRSRADFRSQRRPRGAESRAPREDAIPNFDESLDAPAFGELGLPHPLTSGLANLGIMEPFAIQAATIPDILQGRDVLGRGRTGSGKTLAFGLPMLTRLMGAKSEPRRPRGLVLVPTRELAMQVRDSLSPLAHQAHLSMQLVIGGASYQRQMEGMARGADIVVATPGRLIDLTERRACDLSDVTIAVLDEADQMCDMGFFEDVDHLMGLVRSDAQRLLFSATLDGDVARLVKAHLTDPVEHATDPGTASVSTMTHHLFVVDAREKPEIVHSIARREGRTICFARTQLGVEQWTEELADQGVRVDALHGGKSQASRAKAIENFKRGRVDVLVATDVAARGIHVDDVDLVLQIDPPRDPKDYLHRAGRTARAGKEGNVVLIATTRQIRGVERMLADAGVEALDRRTHAGDAHLAEITGARDEVAPRKAPTRLREEQAVQRAIRDSHDDGLSDLDHREARPRTAPFDDRRSRAHRGDREHHDARRIERSQERPRFSSRREEPWADRAPRGELRDDRGPRRDDRAPREDRWSERAPRGEFRDDRAPRRDDRAPRGEFRPDRERTPRRFDDRAPRQFGERQYGDRPYGQRSSSERRDGGAPRAYGDRAPRNFGDRPYGDRTSSPRPYGERRDDRAPRSDNRGDKPWGARRDDRGDSRSGDRSEGRGAPRDGASRYGAPKSSERSQSTDRRRDDGGERRDAAPRGAGNRKRIDKPRWNAADRKSRNGRGK